MTTINTPLGNRKRLSCGEVTVPTYWGVFVRGDKARLKNQYPQRELDRASGIRANGSLVVFADNGYYYDVPPI